MANYYDVCCRYQGRVVNIRCKNGKRHVGRILRVTNSHVYIQPFGERNLGGFSYGFWGGYGGFYRPYAIPLAFITGVVLGGLFW
ncbi:hypothetical protein [Fredinandcohnia quinoae]|uniref:Uncharacterized protein n=1 Tax=Fredinandcohnia quinoae TaxID=2918902 RepID=A0AAW5E0D5_9BACI|nr:hypothetical protein [Fredinandcohnia sp. SECRCQ15]MCH1626372.1 hypothetical protein [Fredinandcohnia sp. SECRCQ15]